MMVWLGKKGWVGGGSRVGLSVTAPRLHRGATVVVWCKDPVVWCGGRGVKPWCV